MPESTETADARPVWLLDVDGVLNAKRPGWGGPPRQGYAWSFGQPWKFRWAPAVTDFVRETVLSGAVDVRWATTWVRWIDSVEACFRLPSMPCAFDRDEMNVTGLKTVAALAVVEVERRPLVWTDDDVVPLDGEVRERLVGAGVPVLLVRPDERRGLQPEHVEEIRVFFLEHGSARPIAAS